VRDLAMEFVGVDPIDEPVPIQPTAHYSMGGIPATVDGEVLADADGNLVTGFYAAGECACVSVHGANRLGTNSLLGASVFGRRSGNAIAEFIKGGAQLVDLNSNPCDRNVQRVQDLMDARSDENIEDIAQELKTTMTANCGIYRQQDQMQQALDDIKALQARFKQAGVRDQSKRFNTDLLAALETQHLLEFSEVIVASALARTESRGAHYRTDFPKRNDEDWIKHTLAHKRDADEGPALSYKSVYIDYDRYPPQERKY
jgi:succinate dehydrogenase / fumarate reductase flavoprotein subunit